MKKKKYLTLLLGSLIFYLIFMNYSMTKLEKEKYPEVTKRNETTRSKTSEESILNTGVQQPTKVKKQTDRQSEPLPEGAKDSSISITWQELEDKWMEELNSFLLSADYINGESIFTELSKERQKFKVKNDAITAKWQQLHASGIKSGLLVDELEEKSADEIEEYRNEIKRILGPHYLSVKKLYKEYETSIQAYARDPKAPIGVEIGLVD